MATTPVIPTFIKDPDAIIDFVWDWTLWLQSNETISSSTFFITGAGLTTPSNSFTTVKTAVFLAAGTIGTTYTVTNRIVTNQGRTDERSIYVKPISR